MDENPGPGAFPERCRSRTGIHRLNSLNLYAVLEKASSFRGFFEVSLTFPIFSGPSAAAVPEKDKLTPAQPA